jgi:type I restriction-modification system DNA methylase subunit
MTYFVDHYYHDGDFRYPNKNSFNNIYEDIEKWFNNDDINNLFKSIKSNKDQSLKMTHIDFTDGNLLK